MLGISRRTLVSRLTEFGLPRPRKPAPTTGQMTPNRTLANPA